MRDSLVDLAICCEASALSIRVLSQQALKPEALGHLRAIAHNLRDAADLLDNIAASLSQPKAIA